MRKKVPYGGLSKSHASLIGRYLRWMRRRDPETGCFTHDVLKPSGLCNLLFGEDEFGEITKSWSHGADEKIVRAFKAGIKVLDRKRIGIRHSLNPWRAFAKLGIDVDSQPKPGEVAPAYPVLGWPTVSQSAPSGS